MPGKHRECSHSPVADIHTGRAGRRWGSLMRAWWLVHWRAMAVRSALLVAADCVSFITPLLLQALLSCLEAGDSPGEGFRILGSLDNVRLSQTAAGRVAVEGACVCLFDVAPCVTVKFHAAGEALATRFHPELLLQSPAVPESLHMQMR